MTLEGWIFMVGLRVFDVGLFLAWIVWFFWLREDDADLDAQLDAREAADAGDDEGGSYRYGTGRRAPRPTPDAPVAPTFELPGTDVAPWPHRRRDHGGDRPAVPAVRPGRSPRRPRRPVRTLD